MFARRQGPRGTRPPFVVLGGCMGLNGSAPPGSAGIPRLPSTVAHGPVCMNSPDVPGEGRLDADGEAISTLPRIDHVPRPGRPLRARLCPPAIAAGRRVRDPAGGHAVSGGRVATALG